jgi:SAM-dependent methyltransferase
VTRRPRLLDLCCGAGGAARGYMDAGFYVVGVDIEPQPNFCGDEFHQADALTFPLEGADAVHASFPCQHYANVTRWRGSQADHPDLLPAGLARLEAQGVPWVVENVPGAPLRPDFILCGSQFGLQVRRHRWFQTSWHGFNLLSPCQHRGLLPFMHKGERAYADAMGCQWMTKTEAREAIPPAYTRYLGGLLLEQLGTVAA